MTLTTTYRDLDPVCHEGRFFCQKYNKTNIFFGLTEGEANILLGASYLVYHATLYWILKDMCFKMLGLFRSKFGVKTWCAC